MVKKIIILILMLLIICISVSALKNPAAVYCEEMGYEYKIIQTENGQYGECVVEDEEVDAWAFLYGEVAEEYTHCAKEGYELKAIENDERCDNIYSYACSVCILEDGSEVEVSELMGLEFIESECGDDTCGLPENAETCPQDCTAADVDGYCVAEKDGICDLDCEELGTDPDCEDNYMLYLIVGVIALVILIVAIVWWVRKKIS